MQHGFSFDLTTKFSQNNPLYLFIFSAEAFEFSIWFKILISLQKSNLNQTTVHRGDQQLFVLHHKHDMTSAD